MAVADCVPDATAGVTSKMELVPAVETPTAWPNGTLQVTPGRALPVPKSMAVTASTPRSVKKPWLKVATNPGSATLSNPNLQTCILSTKYLSPGTPKELFKNDAVPVALAADLKD